MKILLVTGIYPPDIGGPAGYALRLAQGLVARGHVVQVLTLSDKPSRTEEDDRWSVIRIQRKMFKPFRIVHSMYRIAILGSSADVIYAVGLIAESVAAATLAGRPIVIRIGGDTAWERARSWGKYDGTLEEYQRAPKTPLLMALDLVRSLPIKFVSTIVVPSEFLKQIVSKWAEQRNQVITIYNSIPTSPDTTQRTTKHYDVITVCRLVNFKGVDLLVRAIADIPGIRLAIVGEGPQRDELTALITSLKLEQRVIMLGRLDSDQVFDALKDSRVFVLNSCSEGMPNAVLEAIMAGVCIIATRVGGTPELIIDGISGRLIDFGDHRQLVDSITTLLGCDTQRQTFQANAVKSISEKFSYESMITKTETILMNAVNSGARTK